MACSEVFARKSEAEQHYMETHLKIRYLCDICKAHFSVSEDLKKHSSLMHNPVTPSKRMSARRGAIDEPAISPPEARSIVAKFNEKLCAICHKHFKTFSDTRDHYTSAHDTKIYSCDICNKAYMHFRSLKNHQESHLENVSTR